VEGSRPPSTRAGDAHGGALAVPEGDRVIPVINQLSSEFNLVFTTQDWHPENHCSFAASHPDKKIGDRILIDGHDIAAVTQESLRSQIGMVTQDTSLLHRSVRENILYGRPDASESEMMAAAQRAEATDFIRGLSDPDGRSVVLARMRPQPAAHRGDDHPRPAS